MHIHFEKTINAQCDCTILSMSWMGKVPDELPENEGWKLNRTHYYQEGWLATGNVRGVLGVTYTTSHWKKNPSEVPNRTNYNLRGHRSQITLVQWNEPYQKLASCDSSGIIFVWIKFEGRWSIELINDRNTPVTHFSWSHDGRMALICYQDGFVLVGSVAGQRYWSSMLNLDATITCGIWTPDDQQVYFGTSNGQVVVMDVHGVMVSQVQLPSDSPISSMAWSCEKFKMEESEDGEATSSSNHYCSKRPFLLAVCFKTGGIYLMRSYDDVSPIYIPTGMHGLHMEWSNSGEFLAVAGSRPIEVLHENGSRVKEYSNSLHVYNHQGVRIVNINIPNVLSPVTSMTWGHNDKRVFVSTGKLVHIGWVSKRIASLQLFCRLAIYKALSTESCVSHLPLPPPVRALISSLHTRTIPSLLPNIKDLRDFVTHPPNGNLRLYCTMIRHDVDTNQSPGTAYTLYLEYMGGLIPILKGKRTSKIRPEFVIYDPQDVEKRAFTMMIQNGSREMDREVRCRCTYHHHRHLLPSTQHSSHGVAKDSAGVGTPSHSLSNVGNTSTPSSSSSESCNFTSTSSLTHCHHQRCCHRHSHRRVIQRRGPLSTTSTGSTIGSSTAIGFSDSSESEDVELCASPRMQRKRYKNRQREREMMMERDREREWERTKSSVHTMPEPTHPHQLVYNDVLPEAERLIEVTSNIWGTKFKIHGVSPSLPPSLGQVTYKTSLLHLQPRQMTLHITELRDDIPMSPDLLTTSSYVDDDEDLSIVVGPEPQGPPQQHVQHAAIVMQNGGSLGGGGGGGGGVRGDVYLGANVIYHPQGVPRGDDSPPIISTSRCYLQSPPTNQTQLISIMGANGATAPGCSSGGAFRNTAPGPSSSSGASTSSCCSSLTHYASSTTTTTRSDSAPPYDDEDDEEFPFMDMSNSDSVSCRENVRESTTSAAAAMAGRDSLTFHNTMSNCRSSLCQVCERSGGGGVQTQSQTPIRVTASVGGGGSAEATVDLSDKVMQRVKYGFTKAQIERVVMDDNGSSATSMCGGVATSTPSPPRNSSRSIRSPKKVSGFGGASSSQARLSTPAYNLVSGCAAPPPPPVVAQPIEACVAYVSSSSGPSTIASLHNYHRQQQQQQLVPVTAPMFVRRSMSASYLDHPERNLTLSLDVVDDQAQNTPPKRLILVKAKEKVENDDESATALLSSTGGKPRLKDWGKSKSWDSCDLSEWKKRSAQVANRKESSNSCPKCRFPSTEPIKSVTMAEPLLPCRVKVPMTPVKRMGNCSTNVPSPLAQRNNGYLSSSASNTSSSSKSGSSRDQMSGEDVIEVASDPSSPPSASPTHIPPTPPAPVHRRSLSLLTPLLKRREMLNAARQNADGGKHKNSQPSTSSGPHSSSFIPPGSPQHQPRSSPTTPAAQRKTKQSYLSSASSPFRQLFINSPLLTRRKNKNNLNNNGSTGGISVRSHRRRSIIDSSDDEGLIEELNGRVTPNIAQQPLPPANCLCCCCCFKCDGIACSECLQCSSIPLQDCDLHLRCPNQKGGKKKYLYSETCPMAPRRREFLMHNKAPMWNENSQVYQLDFGGRVTQESAKNFQIEFRGKQVMQFGRIDGSAYTLDFQFPFAAVQAFSVALANVTQRLK